MWAEVGEKDWASLMSLLQLHPEQEREIPLPLKEDEQALLGSGLI